MTDFNGQPLTSLGSVPDQKTAPMLTRQCVGETCTISDFTVCFPDQQLIPDGTTQPNPFYDDINRRSIWSYYITIDAGNKYEHWSLEMCSILVQQGSKDDFLVEFSDDDGVTFTTANGWQLFPSTNTLRINESKNPPAAPSTRIYRIIILNENFYNLVAAPGTVIVTRQGVDAVLSPIACSISPNEPLLTPSVDCEMRPKPPVPPIPPPKISGQCEKILANKVVADQLFICNDTITVDLGESFSGTATLGSTIVTLNGVDCLPYFDTITNRITVNLIYHFQVGAIIDDPGMINVSAEFDLNCRQFVCGVPADVVPEGAFFQVECQSLRNTFSVVAPIIFNPSDPDFSDNATLAITITATSKVVLLQKEILVVGVCSGINSTEISIPETGCGMRKTEITEDIKEFIRKEIKAYF